MEVRVITFKVLFINAAVWLQHKYKHKIFDYNST